MKYIFGLMEAWAQAQMLQMHDAEAMGDLRVEGVPQNAPVLHLGLTQLVDYLWQVSPLLGEQAAQGRWVQAAAEGPVVGHHPGDRPPGAPPGVPGTRRPRS